MGAGEGVAGLALEGAVPDSEVDEGDVFDVGGAEANVDSGVAGAGDAVAASFAGAAAELAGAGRAGAGRAWVVSSLPAETSLGSPDFTSDAFTVIGDAPPPGIGRDVVSGR